jgi:hypothetical protein
MAAAVVVGDRRIKDVLFACVLGEMLVKEP